MNFIEAINYVHAIPKFVRPLGNEKLSGLLDLLGNPHKKLKFIHVAGTNGKGSVCAMTAEILKRAGYKTGLFTSPFIEVFNERIRIDGKMISDSELAKYITVISGIMSENNMQVSEFAFITAVAMKYFSDCGCDIVVLETGMGGKLDATNVIPTPLCVALTSISLDHTAYLGETIEEIALEKCGIIKPDTAAVTVPNCGVIDIIKREAEKNNASLTVCETAKKTAGGFCYKGREYRLGLRGEYQAENAATVCEIINILNGKGFEIDDTAVADGFLNAEHIARYEFITPDIVIDGGHNPDGIQALKKSLLCEARKITLVMAMMSDKDYENCISDIIETAENVVATELDMPRALKCTEIKRICDKYGVACIAEENVANALKTAMGIADGGLICICGSLYLAGEAKSILKKEGVGK